MVIEFQNDRLVEIELLDSPIKDILIEIYRHLQHVKIPFKSWDCPITDDYDKQSLVDVLSEHAARLGIVVDRERLITGDQSYYNILHQIFENNSDGKTAWLNYHESLHLCEGGLLFNFVRIDFRDLAGPLERSFDRRWLSQAVTQIRAGDVFCSWAELGKLPYTYWTDGEPDDIVRLCELAKPWLTLRPHLIVALHDQDFIENVNVTGFNHWWQSYQEKWCAYFGLTDWRWQEMFSVLPVGRIKDLHQLISHVNNKIIPSYIRLQSDRQQQEKLPIEIVIDAQWQSHEPMIDIWVDAAKISVPPLIKGKNKFHFLVEVDQGTHCVTIERNGATYLDPRQTVEINYLSIGGIDCHQLILAKSYFQPRYPEPWATEQKLKGNQLEQIVPYETVLGHDGTWKLQFQSPFYPFWLDINS